jgi:predicted AAA+ superfamily ATPase
MYSRLLLPPKDKSFFLLGPRGTGKTTWTSSVFPDAVRVDLLENRTFNHLLADPQRLSERIPPGFNGWVVIDEIQKIPSLLDEVHRLIEQRRLRFALTGSSARKLRRGGVNLLGGRAGAKTMHPFAAVELGAAFDFSRALRYGLLPSVWAAEDPEDALAGYVHVYLQEEVRQEGLTRNLAAFARFLEAASFSQGSILNIAAVARECAVERKMAEAYFSILDDLLLAIRLSPFTRRSKRRLMNHPKFYFFDVGIFRTLRPRGPLDTPEEAEGPAFETLLLQNILAINDALNLGYTVHYWQTIEGQEVDFVLYGQRGLLAFEAKRHGRVNRQDLRGLKAFRRDYPMAKAFLVYGGNEKRYFDAIQAWPMADLLMHLPDLLKNPSGA